MREPEGPKVFPDRLRQPLVLPKNDAQNERALHAVRATSDGSLDSVAKVIADGRDATASADLSPRARARDDVDPLAFTAPHYRQRYRLPPSGNGQAGAPSRNRLPMTAAVVSGGHLDDLLVVESR